MNFTTVKTGGEKSCKCPKRQNRSHTKDEEIKMASHFSTQHGSYKTMKQGLQNSENHYLPKLPFWCEKEIF